MNFLHKAIPCQTPFLQMDQKGLEMSVAYQIFAFPVGPVREFLFSEDHAWSGFQKMTKRSMSPPLAESSVLDPNRRTLALESNLTIVSWIVF